MTRKRMMGWVVTAIAGAALVAAPGEAFGQEVSGEELATRLEEEATRLRVSADGWADAASLYMAAAQARQHEDPVARQDLFLAANLYYQVGDLAASVSALESAARRALAGGDAVLAVEMFANAASVAEEAGLGREERRLRARASDLALALRADGSIRG